MALPITKKAAASCAKNMEKGTMTYQTEEPNMVLIMGEKAKAPKFVDVRKEVEKGMDKAQSEDDEV